MVVPGFAGFRGWAGRAAVAVVVVDDGGSAGGRRPGRGPGRGSRLNRKQRLGWERICFHATTNSDSEGAIYHDSWTPFIMNEYLKRMIQSPRNPNAANETCEESAGVFRRDDLVVIYGSFSERDTEFETILTGAAKAVAWDRGLPRPDRFHGEDNWAIIIPAFGGCADEVLREIRTFLDGLLVDYDNWLALGCDDDQDVVS